MMDLTPQKLLQASTEQLQGDIVSSARASGEWAQDKVLDVLLKPWRIGGAPSYRREPAYNATELKNAGCTGEERATAGYKAPN